MPPTIAPDRIDWAVDIIERHKPYEGMNVIIDEVYAELKQLFQEGEVSQPDFVEYRSRLWSKREEVSEALLPEGQRERVKAIP